MLMYNIQLFYLYVYIVCITDEQSVVYPPSMVASACICAAMRDLTTDWKADLYARILRDIIGADLVSAILCHRVKVFALIRLNNLVLHQQYHICHLSLSLPGQGTNCNQDVV